MFPDDVDAKRKAHVWTNFAPKWRGRWPNVDYFLLRNFDFRSVELVLSSKLCTNLGKVTVSIGMVVGQQNLELGEKLLFAYFSKMPIKQMQPK